MDYKSQLVLVARDLAGKFDSMSDIPMVAINGSIGDLYGYVTEKSDADLIIWASDARYMQDAPAIDWSPHRYLRRPIAERDFCVDLVECRGCKCSAVFVMFNPDEFQADLDFLRSSPAERRKIDFYVRHFVETEKYKDSEGHYERAKKTVMQAFSRYRGELARESFWSIRLPVLKIRDDYELSGNNTSIDIIAYNDRVINVVHAMTYILCCVNNIPRSYSSIERRRKNVLWNKLGIDTMINSLISPTGDVRNSFATVGELVTYVYDKARAEFAELETDESIARTLERLKT